MGEKESKKLIKFISDKGGYGSLEVNLVSKADNVKRPKLEVGYMSVLKNDIECLKNVASNIEKSVDELKVDELKGVVASIIPKVVGQIREESKTVNEQLKDVFGNMITKALGELKEDLLKRTKAQERNSKNVLVKNDVSSNDITPMNLQGTVERKPSHKISSPYVKLDKLEVMGNKLDLLTTKLIEDRSRKLQNIGPFIGCRNLYDDDKYLIAFVFLELDEDELTFIVFETNYHHLDSSGMKCLQPGELVTSLV
ncbi:hypothetical protein ACLB2K_026809 [Fragaria x ananassa]